MPKRRLHNLLISLVLSGALCFSQSGAGVVRAVIDTNPQWDPLIQAPSPGMQQWFQTNAWRMLVFSPHFDRRLSWYPNGWAYLDLYAIYASSQLKTSHPDWILRDGKGNPLYIPFACSRGTCPQYAADVSNPDFKAYWMAQATKLYLTGYRGLWVDDVNLELRVSDGNGVTLAPIDRRTGRPMTISDWKDYVATFTEEIRATFPGWEIVHNAIWYAGGSARTADPSVQREILAADYIYLERGVSDSGLKGGSGQYSLNDFFSYIDGVHQLNRSIVLENNAQQTDYGLAAYFLVSNGSDGLASSGLFPDSWPTSYSIDLGEPLGPRFASNGLLCRDFERGIAVINPPANSPFTIAMPSGPLTVQPAGGVVLQMSDAYPINCSWLTSGQ